MLITPSLNSQAGVRNFEEKKLIFEKANLFVAKEVAREEDWRTPHIEGHRRYCTG